MIERLERFPQLRSIPVIVISARTAPETRERAMAAGAAAFIEKPFDAESLLAVIEQILTAPPLASQAREFPESH